MRLILEAVALTYYRAKITPLWPEIKSDRRNSACLNLPGFLRLVTKDAQRGQTVTTRPGNRPITRYNASADQAFTAVWP